MTLTTDKFELYGPLSIVGRGCGVHGKEDDLGRGNNDASLRNGNSGPAIGCGIVGLITGLDMSTSQSSTSMSSTS